MQLVPHAFDTFLFIQEFFSLFCYSSLNYVGILLYFIKVGATKPLVKRFLKLRMLFKENITYSRFSFNALLIISFLFLVLNCCAGFQEADFLAQGNVDLIV